PDPHAARRDPDPDHGARFGSRGSPGGGRARDARGRDSARRSQGRKARRPDRRSRVAARSRRVGRPAPVLTDQSPAPDAARLAAMGLRVCLVTPFAWSRPHDVNEHVAGIARELRLLGHYVTVLAPSTRASDLIEGRRALLDWDGAEVIAL